MTTVEDNNNSSPSRPRSNSKRRIEPFHLEQPETIREDAVFVSLRDIHYNNNNNSESKTSLLSSILTIWLYECAWPGMGLFGESYLLFSIGTLRPIWEFLYPLCEDNNNNNNNNSCTDASLLSRMSWTVVLGVVVGMTMIGYAAGTLGRRRGSILTASLMAGGACGLTGIGLLGLENGNTVFSIMAILWFLFGIGVGGEYPLSASLASEQSMQELHTRRRQEQERQGQQPSSRSLLTVGDFDDYYAQYNDEDEQQLHSHSSPMSPDNDDDDNTNTQRRGQRVQLVFMMQGLGILVNCILQTILLLVFGQTSPDRYERAALLRIWHITYGFGTVILLTVLVTRILYLQESEAWLDDQQQQQQQKKQQEQLDNMTAGGDPPTVMRSPMGTTASSIVAVTPRSNASTAMPHQQPPQQQQPTTSNPFLKDTIPIITTVSSVSDLSIPSVALHVTEQQGDMNRFYRHLNTTVNNNNNNNSNNNNNNDNDSTDNYNHYGNNNNNNNADMYETWFRRLVRYYGMRVLGASISWLLWDVAFYGNKLFQSTFLLALTGNETTLLEASCAASLNALVAQAGYVGAAILTDRVGRLRLQQAGFFLTAILFLACGFLYEYLPSIWLVLLYLGSSFFGQCGPNATTFVVPAEIVPTRVRTQCHGLAAASGKVGALLAAFAFDRLDQTTDMFLVAGYTSLAAALVTFWTLPDTTQLDLYELDRQWRLGKDYTGPATQHKHLSHFERTVVYGMEY